MHKHNVTNKDSGTCGLLENEHDNDNDTDNEQYCINYNNFMFGNINKN